MNRLQKQVRIGLVLALVLGAVALGNSSTRLEPGIVAAVQPAPNADEAPDSGYWLTVKSGVRHNATCRWYRVSKGRACKICGG